MDGLYEFFVLCWQLTDKAKFILKQGTVLSGDLLSLRMWFALSCVNRENILQNGLEYPSRGLNSPYRNS